MEHTIVVDDIHDNRDAWLDARQNKIGSSEITTVVGLNPYQTRLNLWLLKTNQIEREPEQLRLRMGQIKEPIIAQLFHETTGLKVWRNDRAFALKEHPWALATPDYYYEIEEEGAPMTGILEIKNVSAYSKKDWDDNQIPNYAHIQIIWQMGIAGIKRGKVCALISDNELAIRDVEFDQGIFDSLLHLGVKFMELVDTMTPPEAVAADAKSVSKIFDENDSVVELNRDDSRWITQFLVAQEEKSRLSKLVKAEEDKMKEAQANLLLAMKGSQSAVYNQAIIYAKTHVVKGHYRKESVQQRFAIKLNDQEYPGGEN